ncbi:MAG: 4-hydroxy-3-polyprenylbenzoate decarboxylase [Glaciecola sp.]|jgi:4-hydroxy-3-polyprenylbenzoate decarboxylase
MSRFFVGITGASGHRFAQTLIRALVALEHEVHVCLTPAGSLVMAHELGLNSGENGEGLPDLLEEWIGPEALGRVSCYDPRDVGGKPASGTARIEATILVPCSMGTMARVAAGFSSNLVERAADVALKEGRTLMIMPRETPLSRVHLKNMLSLAELGTVILPCMPGWYHNPETLQDLLDHGVGKALDRLGVEHHLGKRWAGLKELPEEPGTQPPSGAGGAD